LANPHQNRFIIDCDQGWLYFLSKVAKSAELKCLLLAGKSRSLHRNTSSGSGNNPPNL
jgi:hypothetical protein